MEEDKSSLGTKNQSLQAWDIPDSFLFLKKMVVDIKIVLHYILYYGGKNDYP